MPEIERERVDELLEKLRREASEGGYFLNPDEDFTRELVEGILVNIDRYGYGACPCRLASGNTDEDLDIVCPCDYRDPDLDDFGACYCGLYVSQEIANGEKQFESIPERRPAGGAVTAPEVGKIGDAGLRYPVFRCKVCGYLCARDNPPAICPVCKVGKERFERFF
ncbi:MAG TPA: ferredoxin:glutaredoxin reductase [candidate division Zixibacteria bacterium]|nr:ferredoxin:glutaredoxin reductase [candidate division Zixibacteria bacterium]